MDSLGNILYWCTLLHIICEHLHDLYTLNSLSGWKELINFIHTEGLSKVHSNIYSILFAENLKHPFKVGNRPPTPTPHIFFK